MRPTYIRKPGGQGPCSLLHSLWLKYPSFFAKTRAKATAAARTLGQNPRSADAPPAENVSSFGLKNQVSEFETL
jgi:hypothetical protein